MTSAPIGAFVTVWGAGLGTVKGAVKVGSLNIVGADVLSWSDTKVEFKLVSGAGSGISLQLADGFITNQLSFISRIQGRIYYISKSNGSNSNTGLSATQQSGTLGPWRDLTNFASKLAPGDVVYVRSGTYNEYDVRGGSSWGTVLYYSSDTAPRGTAALPVAIVGYPGEKPVLGVTNAKRSILIGQSYVTIAKLTFGNNTEEAIYSMSGTGIRIVGNEAANLTRAPYNIIGMEGCTNCQILGNHLHDSGMPGNKQSHLIYYGGFGAGANVEIAYNNLYNALGGRAIQVYGHTASDVLTNVSIHHNIVHDIPYDGILVGDSDEKSNSNWVKDGSIQYNLVYRSGDAGIRVDNGGMTVRINNNTLHGNGTSNGSHGNGYSGLLIQNAKRADIGQNILSSNRGGSIVCESNVFLGVVAGNGYFNNNVFSSDTSPVSGDPQYLNPNSGDYRLGNSSPMRGLGCFPQ